MAARLRVLLPVPLGPASTTAVPPMTTPAACTGIRPERVSRNSSRVSVTRVRSSAPAASPIGIRQRASSQRASAHPSTPAPVIRNRGPSTTSAIDPPPLSAGPSSSASLICGPPASRETGHSPYVRAMASSNASSAELIKIGRPITEICKVAGSLDIYYILSHL